MLSGRLHRGLVVSFPVVTRAVKQSILINQYGHSSVINKLGHPAVNSGHVLFKHSGPPTKMPAIDNQINCSSCGSPARRLSSSQRVPFMIGVAGGTASGKSTVCKTIMSRLGQHEVNNLEKQVVALSQDSFYRELDEKEAVLASKGKFNFDHPDAFDNALMEQCLNDIIEGRPTKVPVYDFKTNSRVPGEFTMIYPSDVVLVEGILIFYYAKMRDMFQLKLFVDTDPDTRLARRVMRDIQERGRELDHVLTQYTTLVKPAFEEFCIPTKKFADVIVPRGAENIVAIDLIVQHIQDIIWRSNGSKSGSPLSRSRSNSDSKIR